MTQMTIILFALLSMTVGIEQARPGSTTYNEKTGQSSRPNNKETGGRSAAQTRQCPPECPTKRNGYCYCR